MSSPAAAARTSRIRIDRRCKQRQRRELSLKIQTMPNVIEPLATVSQ